MIGEPLMVVERYLTGGAARTFVWGGGERIYEKLVFVYIYCWTGQRAGQSGVRITLYVFLEWVGTAVGTLKNFRFFYVYASGSRSEIPGKF